MAWFALIPVAKLIDATIDLATPQLKGWLSAKAKRRVFHRAVKDACNSFASSYPEYNDWFFDETFLKNNVAPLLTVFLTERGRIPDSPQIVAAWQRSSGLSVQSDDPLTTAAGLFLEGFRRQLMAHPELDDLVDQAIRDQEAGDIREIRDLTRQSMDLQRRDAYAQGFIGLFTAACEYDAAAAEALAGRDPRNNERAAQLAATVARYWLQRFEYVAVASVLADFDQCVLSPWEGFCEALGDGNTGAASAYASELRIALAQLDERLEDAP
jgi:hypothetical protein